MTKSEFQNLQLRAASSGTTLKEFLRTEGVAYSTYNYWCKKMKSEASPLPIAPIEIRPTSQVSFATVSMNEVELPGVTLAFPNEVRAHFGRRKNHLFCGNHESAENMCVIQSLLATCRNHDINPRLYLNSVVAAMPYFEKTNDEELRVLLPHKWKEFHPEAVMTTPVRQLAK